MPTPIYLTADIRALESRHSHLPLMERAGEATARLARELALQNGQPVLITAGPGNNGGDAFVAARYLRQWFHAVTVVFADDPAKLPQDARTAYHLWRDAGGRAQTAWPERREWSLVIDGLLGIGIKRPIEGKYAHWLTAMQQCRAPVLAIDIPSGLDADTGATYGMCARATHTLTFLGLKPGLLTMDGPDYCGTLHTDTLGTSAGDVPAPGWVLEKRILRETLAPRVRNSHKGKHGSTAIIGGATGMVGAALLAGRAAQHLGAGRVYAGLLADGAPSVDLNQPELMLRSVADALAIDHLSCIAIGPGLGTSELALHCLEHVLAAQVPLVLDADALNLAASSAKIKTQLKQSVTENILTPHPAEAARLLGVSTRDIQANRIAAAQKIADEFNAHVVLKGAGSICASPRSAWHINTTGNPGMASAGMGDVLTGIIAALLSQGAPPANALRAAVWLHGAAADQCAATGLGPVGLTASETITTARQLLNAALPPHPWVNGSCPSS